MSTFKISGKELYELFDEIIDTSLVVDQEYVDFIKEDYDRDLTKFIGLKIEQKWLNQPEHDMDNHDIIFYITTPDKKKYYMNYNTNSFRGNDFNENEIYVLEEVISEEKKLENLGWTITCESPFEIEHEDGSSATGQAADIVKNELINNYEDYI